MTEAKGKGERAPRPEDDDSYDPYAERQVVAPTTDIETIINILKGVVGLGFLALPQAFSKVGMLLGSVLLVLLGYLGAYCMCLLMRSQYILCKRQKVPYLEYQDSMKAAFADGPACLRPIGPVARGTVNVFYVANQFGICCAYLSFIAKSIQAVVKEHHPEIHWIIQVYITFIFVLFLAITYVPNMKFFAPLSGVAIAINVVGIGIILYYVFQDFPSPLERPFVTPIDEWLLFVGTTLFAVMSVGLCTSGERSMKNPGHFGGIFGVCSISTTITIIMYWFVGFMAYVKYGDEARDSISLNIPTKEPLAQSTQCLFATSIAMSLGIQLYPGIEILWYCYILPKCNEKSNKTQWCYQYILRTCLAVLIYAVTCAFGEEMGIIISLTGVICVAMLGITFPALMDLCVLWPDRLGKYRWLMWKDIIIIFIGFFALILGTYMSIDDFIKKILSA